MTRLDVGWLEAVLAKAKKEREEWRTLAEELAAEVERHGHGGLVGYTPDCSSCDALRRFKRADRRANL